jgi:luciferase family oxidoreductase group 1
MAALSILDLSPILQGGDARGALDNSLDLARQAERLGYTRYWVAEHHNMPGVASAATAVVIAHLAAGTKTIRLGAGGVMLPNHAPLTIAEQFGTLECLHPGRIDLGLGRAPGSDPATAQALRRTLSGDVDRFPSDVVELMRYFEPLRPGQRVQAVPGAGLNVPIWILGSSTFGAQLAAALGLPFAFASHFAPADLDAALSIYRSQFKASAHLQRPYVMVGLNVVAADTDEEAAFLFTSLQQAFVNLRLGRPGPLPPPSARLHTIIDPEAQPLLQQALSRSLVGSVATVQAGLEAFVRRTQADEVMATAQIFDHAARVRSFEILAAANAQTRTAEPLRRAV